jgi:hypothetical protein
MDKKMRERGAIQRRYRALLARRGWTSVATYMRVEHREALERVKRRHGLRNLHEALDLVLAGSELTRLSTIAASQQASFPRLSPE